MIAPRFSWVPPRVRSLGPDCVAWFKAHGGRLFGWQELVIDGILGVDGSDQFVSSNDGVCVARQNGKGVIEMAIEAFCTFELGYALVMHTAHEFPTSQEHQLRLEAFIQDDPELHSRVKDRGGYVHANGQESIRLKTGERIVFKARTKGGGRGYSGDLLVWDEAMVIPAAVVAAQKPMLRASQAPNGQKTIYAGSAVDQQTHVHGIPFSLIRERGLEQAAGVSWHEWGAPFDDPSQMTIDVLRDRSWWSVANPSMPEGLISESYMGEEIDTMPARVAAVELANVGDWPRTDGMEESVISAEDWAALERRDARLEGSLCLAIDVSPERQTSIAVAGRSQFGMPHVEIHEDRPGTSWVVDRVVQMTDSGLIDVVVLDSVGPAASLIKPLEEAGVRVEPVNTQEHGQACGRFVDLVEEAGMTHLGSDELRDAVLGAAQRPLGDSWAWSRKNSSVNIAPLVAATLAVGALEGVTSEMAIW